MDGHRQQPSRLLCQMLHLVCLFSCKIEQTKLKLCGFADFNPEMGFKQIDRQNRGYLTVQALRSFLDNKIFSRDIELLFYWHGDLERLTFLSFLKVVRPYSDKMLAEQIAYRTTGKSLNPEHRELLVEVLTLKLVMLGQLQALKLQLANSYCLNPHQIRGMIGYDQGLAGSREGILRIMAANGYSKEDYDMKYLQVYLNAKVDLTSDSQIQQIFLPTHFVSAYLFQPDDTYKSTPKLQLQTKTDYLSVKMPEGKTYSYNRHNSIHAQNQAEEGSLPLRPNYGQRLPKATSLNQQESFHKPQTRNVGGTSILDLFTKNSGHASSRPDINQHVVRNIQNESARSIPQSARRPQRQLDVAPDQGFKSPIRPVQPDFAPTTVLDDFIKCNDPRQKFQDQVSLRSGRAFLHY